MTTQDKYTELPRWASWAGLVACTLVAALVRLYRLDAETPWYDEVCSLQFLGEAHLTDFLRLQRTAEPATIPLFYALQFGWSRVFGSGIIAARALPILFSLLCIPMIYLVGKRVANSAAGLTAAWCFALSMAHAYYAQETRGYSLVLFLTLGSAYALLRASNGDAGRWWALHFAANTAIAWTHLLAPLFILATGVWLLCTQYRRRRLLLAWTAFHAVLLLTLLAWVRSMDFPYLNEATDVYGKPPLRDVLNAYLVYCGGRFSNESPAAFLLGGITFDWVLGVLMVVLSALGALRGERRAVLLLVMWLILPVVLIVVMSYLWRPCFHYRYTLHCALPLLLLVGIGAQSLPRMRLRYAAIALLTILLGYQASVRASAFRPDYRAAARMISAADSTEAPVLVLKYINQMGMAYNAPELGGRMVPLGGQDHLFAMAERTAMEHGHFWVVMWRWDALDAWDSHLDTLELQYTRHTLEGMPPLHLYEVTR